MDLLAPESVYRLHEGLHPPTIVAQGPVSQAGSVAALDLGRDILERAGDAQGTLARLDGTVRLAHKRQMVAHVDRDPSQPSWVLERAGEGLGFLQVRVYPLALSEWVQRVAQV